MLIQGKDVLIQFRLPFSWEVPPGVRDRDEETQDEYEARTARNESRGPMERLLERNGASLANVEATLLQGGRGLVDAHVQRRCTMATDFRGERPYSLLTFVFREGGKDESNAHKVFRDLANRRWEYISVNGSDGLISMVAKTMAQPAKELRPIDDSYAGEFGIVVTKSVPKARRELQEQHHVAPTPTPAPSQVTQSATGDTQLDRLLRDGWKIASRTGRCAELEKGEGSQRQTMTHFFKKK